MQVYVLEHSGRIEDYASLSEYKRKRFLVPRSGALKGCFIQNGQMGQIRVKPISVLIKGLDTDYEFKHTFRLTNWHKVVAFMQHASLKKPDSPAQLVDRICAQFLRSLQRAEAKMVEVIKFNALHIFKK